MPHVPADNICRNYCADLTCKPYSADSYEQLWAPACLMITHVIIVSIAFIVILNVSAINLDNYCLCT